MDRARDNVEIEVHSDNDQMFPLLQNIPPPYTADKNQRQEAINQAFQSIAHLANLLPTGIVRAFHLLASIFTNMGDCDDASQLMTSALTAICALASFILSFSETFKDNDGNVYLCSATNVNKGDPGDCYCTSPWYRNHVQHAFRCIHQKAPWNRLPANR